MTYDVNDIAVTTISVIGRDVLLRDIVVTTTGVIARHVTSVSLVMTSCYVTSPLRL